MDHLINKWKNILEEERSNLPAQPEKEKNDVFFKNDTEEVVKTSKSKTKANTLGVHEENPPPESSKRLKSSDRMKENSKKEAKKPSSGSTNSLSTNQFFLAAQKSGDVIDKCTCTIFEIILSTDNKTRLKEKFQNVVGLLKNMFNGQIEIISKQEKS